MFFFSADPKHGTVLHVLVAPDNAELVKRIRSRDQSVMTEQLIAGNNWRMQNRAFYDLVLTGNEPIANILELIHKSIR